jgi:hypothetical protein
MSWFVAGKELARDLAVFLLPSKTNYLAIKSSPMPLALPDHVPVKPAPEVVPIVAGAEISVPKVVLYAARAGIKLWQRPVVAQDGVVGHLQYGQQVLVFDYEGRFAHVRTKDLIGYVLKDDLESLREALYPTFHDGEIYTSNHPDTKKLRRLINDEFATEDLYMALQSSEFVMYRLSEKGLILPWGSERPRTVGNWHNLLKGKLGVVMSVAPKTGSLIEFQKDDGTGWVGYVKAVSVDNTLLVEGVGRIIEGEYKEESLSKSLWQEWRPVFIAVG